MPRTVLALLAHRAFLQPRVFRASCPPRVFHASCPPRMFSGDVAFGHALVVLPGRGSTFLYPARAGIHPPRGATRECPLACWRLTRALNTFHHSRSSRSNPLS
eukprot:3189860-Pyramimonas_sp.AAC.1